MVLTDRRTLTTLLYLLRRHAEDTLRMHGKLSEREGGHVLTPHEMIELADRLEAGAVTLQQDELLG